MGTLILIPVARFLALDPPVSESRRCLQHAVHLGWSPRTLAAGCKVSLKTVRGWLDGSRTPNSFLLQQVAPAITWASTHTPKECS